MSNDKVTRAEYKDFVKKVVLEKGEFVMESVMSEASIVGRSKVEAVEFVEFYIAGMAIRMKKELLKQKMNEIAFPEDWWQAFKHRWFPTWLKRKFPVKMSIYNVEAYYPSMEIEDDNSFVRFHKIE